MPLFINELTVVWPTFSYYSARNFLFCIYRWLPLRVCTISASTMSIVHIATNGTTRFQSRSPFLLHQKRWLQSVPLDTFVLAIGKVAVQKGVYHAVMTYHRNVPFGPLLEPGVQSAHAMVKLLQRFSGTGVLLTPTRGAPLDVRLLLIGFSFGMIPPAITIVLVAVVAQQASLKVDIVVLLLQFRQGPSHIGNQVESFGGVGERNHR